ncbi:serine/threonine-protein phosphatase 4 regulatory subunit 4 [Bombina bombina]|uniref:serine/threonine-protein phosphatase 4 regulatory subunit 4 n=1 Tax=Bombina bombina TaxID=8345 RepID=UPI00235B2094|nr:serine/threonine-protein phosphatase 4 regulatory subunit 4 [Bombina bombina]
MQLTAAYSFLTTIQEDSASILSHSHNFLQIISQHLEHRDAGVSSAWLDTLLVAIDAFPKEAIRHEILSPLVSKAQLSQTVQSRLASCKILGKLANKFDTHTIKRDILPLVKSLSQDIEYEVRSCMCRQLEFVAQGIGTELTKTSVLPELVELAQDESSSVRLAAFETLVNLLVMFDHDDRSQIVLPLVKSFCEKSFKTDDSALASLSLQLGKLCHGLQGIFTQEQHIWYLEFYKKLCRFGLHQENGHNDNQIQNLEIEKKSLAVRKNCAYNFPAMVLFVGSKNFHVELYATYFCLCHDPDVPVRVTVALGFYEVCKLLGSNVYLIHKELVSLLQDESLEVIDGLLDHLPETLEIMTSGDSSGLDNKLMIVPDLIPALSSAEQRAAKSLKWRSHEKLLHKYSCLSHILSSDQIYYRFLHRMFTIILTSTALPVQKAASRTLCMFLRYNRKQEQRNEIIQKLIEQLCQGKSYWNRLRFLDTCEYIMELFSKSFFCKYFFLPVLELTSDPVVNVRLKICSMLPKLKAMLKLPADNNLLQELELCIRRLLCQEPDEEVIAVVKRSVVELDRMDIAMDAFQKRYYEKDLLDEEKEREEHLMLEMEQIEKEKQQSEARTNEKAFEKKRRDSKTGATLTKNLPTVISGSSSSGQTSMNRDVKKSKLIRSQSFSSQAIHTKQSTIEKCANKGSGCNSVLGVGKNVLLPFVEDSLKTRTSSASGVLSYSSSLKSTSRSSGNINDPKTNGNKDTQARKLSLKNRKPKS